MNGFRLYPEAASTLAGETDRLFLWLSLFALLIVLTVAIGVVVFATRYHHSSRHAGTSRQPPPRIQRRIEFGFIGFMLVAGIAFFLAGARVYTEIFRPPPGALTVYGVGKQWMWKFQHPDGQREINSLHLPVNRPVQLILISQDVIHSFYVPAFRIKQDVVPGRYNRTVVTPTKIGRFPLYCAEYCGTGHSRMDGEIVVMSEDAYGAWLADQPVGGSAERGAELFRIYGCSGCHAPRSNVHAPPLTGIWGRPQHLQDGSTVIVDHAYVRDSILLPKKQIVVGYAPIMPSFAGEIPEGEILSLIAYIRSLRDEEVLP